MSNDSHAHRQGQENHASPQHHGAGNIRALMLQGPVGPFFQELAASLEAEDVEVTRLIFNKGDLQHSDPANSIPVTARISDFENQLRTLADTGIDIIVLFGSERPAHKIARKIAAELLIPVASFEEGYIRPGTITLEVGGNNASSPIAKLSLADLLAQDFPEHDSDNFRGFWPMVYHGAGYYLRREVFASDQEKEFFHRQTPLAEEAYCWGRNVARKTASGRTQEKIVKSLIRDFQKDFFIVPLQVPSDANIKEAANGWDTPKLAHATIKSFARAAPKTSRLAFKIHPMARGHARDHHLIYNLADKYHIASRTLVLHSGAMGDLAGQASGMITINSTSGLSAIHHGTPLLALGQSIYAHPELATLGTSDADFDPFWTNGHVASAELRQKYLAHIRDTALLPGDFYARAGRRIGAQNATRRILQIAFENKASS